MTQQSEADSEGAIYDVGQEESVKTIEDVPDCTQLLVSYLLVGELQEEIERLEVTVQDLQSKLLRVSADLVLVGYKLKAERDAARTEIGGLKNELKHWWGWANDANIFEIVEIMKERTGKVLWPKHWL